LHVRSLGGGSGIFEAVCKLFFFREIDSFGR